MKPLVLAFSVWIMGLAASFAGLILTGSDAVRLEGKIVLQYSPFCESFVVQTPRGFSLLDWDDGILVFAAGDEVAGPLHARGLQSIDLVGHGEMKVRVTGWSPDLRQAQLAFRDRCKLDDESLRMVALPQ